LFMTVLAAVRATLARYTGQSHLVVGAPIDNRSHAELAGLIGMFANTIALSGEVRADDSFASLLAREKATALAAYEHQHTPFELVVDALQVERSLSRTPVFQVMYQHVEPQVETGPSALVAIEPELQTKFDLSVLTRDHGGQLDVELVYNVALFERALIEQLAR